MKLVHVGWAGINGTFCAFGSWKQIQWNRKGPCLNCKTPYTLDSSWHSQNWNSINSIHPLMEIWRGVICQRVISQLGSSWEPILTFMAQFPNRNIEKLPNLCWDCKTALKLKTKYQKYIMLRVSFLCCRTCLIIRHLWCTSNYFAKKKLYLAEKNTFSQKRMRSLARVQVPS